MIALSTLIASRVLAARATLLLGVGVMVGSGHEAPPAVRQQPTAPTERELPAALFTPMAPALFAGERARLANARLGFSGGPNPAAAAFHFAGDDVSRERAVTCLAAAVYYEAASESVEGREAVAQVVLNRVRHPAYPSSVCAVVFEGSTLETGCQFSFACDGSMLRRPDAAGWRAAADIARAALDGKVAPAVGLATHYHADYVLPYWAFRLRKNAQMGLHIFYRWPGDWGMPPAFRKRPASHEPDVAALMAAAVMRLGKWPALDAVEPGPWLTFVRDPETERLVRAALAADQARPPAEAIPEAGSPEPSAPLPLMADESAAVAPASAPAPLPRFRPAERRALGQATIAVNDALADFTAYSGLSLPPRRLAALPIAAGAPGWCAASRTMAGIPWWSMATPGDSSAPTARLIDSGALDLLFAPRLPAPVARQLLSAVFLRIADLREGRASDRRNSSVASDLVPALVVALRGFERQRHRYATLSDYLPELIRQVPQVTQATLPVDDPCAAPDPAPAAAADASAARPGHVG